MKSFFKKYGIFFVLGIFVAIFLYGVFIKSPNDRLKKYLGKIHFAYNSNSEMIYEDPSLEKYENNEADTYTSITYNYNNSTFYQITRFKEDGYENSYNLTFDIVNGFITGDYKKENEYDTWYIEGTYDEESNKYNCNTNGYKGMIEYCDLLQEKIDIFESTVFDYLENSKTIEHYMKKWEN